MGEPGALELVQRARLRDRQQLLRGLRRPRLELGLRGGQRPPAATGRDRGQLCRSLEEGGRRGDAAAVARAAGRALQLVGHGLVETRRGVRAMPCAPIGIELRVGRLGQRAMDVAAVRHARRPVRRRAHQRMPEPHPRADVDQARGLGRRGLVGLEPEQLGRAPQQRHVADGLGRREQQQLPGLARQRLQLPHEALLDAADQRHRAGQPEPAGHRAA